MFNQASHAVTVSTHGSAILVAYSPYAHVGGGMTAVADRPSTCTPDTTDLVTTRALTAAQQRRAAARARDLTALMRERPELSGVHAPADLAVEAVRWCA